MEKVCEYEGSSLWGMNGGQPESPDGTLLVYAKKPDLEDKEKQITEIWICDRNTLANARCVFTVAAATTMVHLPLLQIMITLFFVI